MERKEFNRLIVSCCMMLLPGITFTQTFVKVDLAPGGIVHDGYLHPESMKIGTGAAWFDANADGHLDLYVTMRMGPNFLWIGDGRGNFVESAVLYGVANPTGDGAGVSAADFNNDGFTDLYLANGLSDRLYRNDDGEGFTDITASAGFDITNKSRGTSASWADFNNDGFLDLFVTNHNKIPGTTNSISQDRLYVNNSDETFTDVSNLLMETGSLDGYGFIGGWTDFDHDGDPDLILVNDCFQFLPIPTPNQFFRNDGDTHETLMWKFTEIGDSLGINYCENGMGIAIADYNRDGWMDYHYSNVGPSILMKNTGADFLDVSTLAGVNGQPFPLYSWGTIFADVNLDGWSDLYLALGGYHYPSTTDPQHNMFFLNNGNGINFTDVSALMNLDDSTRTRTIVAGDYDEDGDPDFAIINYGEEIILKRNDLHQTGHYLKIDLVGTTSNRDGIGAKLTVVTPDNVKQYWEMRSGSSLGGGDALTALFGLDTNTTVDTLHIAWPSGIQQTVTNIPGDHRIVIEEFDPDSAEVVFVDVAQQNGIDTTCGFCGVGNGVSFADFNDDGLDDLTFGTQMGDSLLFYKNTGSGFVKIPALVNNIGKQEQILWVDLDNDGDKDLVVSSFNGQNRIYKNTGNLQMVDVTFAAGIAAQNDPSYGVVAADYDKDGDLDLYFANWAWNNVHSNYLYTNDGDFTFTNNTVVAGVTDSLNNLTFCSAFFDYDGDGWLDLYNSQDRYTDANSLYRNNGNGTFTNVSEISQSDIAIDAMNVGVGDYDLDGDFDIYITNTSMGNVLLQNQGDGTFEDVAEDLGVGMYKQAWGGNWVDVDHDRDLDLYVSAMHMGSACSSELYLNAFPQDTFSSMNFTGDSLNSFSNAIGDFNNDGQPDIAVNNGIPGDIPGCTQPGSPVNNFHLWENQSVTGNHWLKVRLRGIESNRDGIGSLIKLYIDGEEYLRTTHCGIAYLAQNSLTEFFGLGTSMSADSLKVFWPSGDHVTTLYQVMGDQSIIIYETDRLYVDVSATGADDGLTWDGAFTDLQEALSFAETNHMKEIWIANGTYHPAISDRTKSFVIPSGVHLFGGFAGSETLMSQRDPVANTVVLSGDIGVGGEPMDNAYHVVRVDIGSENCVLDGLSIIAGQATGADAIDQIGAGVYCAGELVLRQVVIDQCMASHTGYAAYATGANAQLTMDDVIAMRNVNAMGSVFANSASAILNVTGSTEIREE